MPNYGSTSFNDLAKLIISLQQTDAGSVVVGLVLRVGVIVAMCGALLVSHSSRLRTARLPIGCDQFSRPAPFSLPIIDVGLRNQPS
jgi:hypothetical protein